MNPVGKVKRAPEYFLVGEVRQRGSHVMGGKVGKLLKLKFLIVENLSVFLLFPNKFSVSFVCKEMGEIRNDWNWDDGPKESVVAMKLSFSDL